MDNTEIKDAVKTAKEEVDRKIREAFDKALDGNYVGSDCCDQCGNRRSKVNSYNLCDMFIELICPDCGGVYMKIPTNIHLPPLDFIDQTVFITSGITFGNNGEMLE